MDPAPRVTFWQAPLVPLGLAVTAGIGVDRYTSASAVLYALVFVAGLAAWCIGYFTNRRPVAFVFLGLSVFALAAGYHHFCRHFRRADDISHFAAPTPRLVRVRGLLLEQPRVQIPPKQRPLHSRLSQPFTRVLLQVTALEENRGWQPVSGRVQLTISQSLTECHAGDEIEVLGRLAVPASPGNPGEHDYASTLQDRRIGALMSVRHSPFAVKKIRSGWSWQPRSVLATVRRHARSTLEHWLPPAQHSLARALLLGEQAALEQADWNRFQRTGVCHVLAISGQHLVVLAWFLGIVLRILQIPRRRGVLIVSILLVGYALLTGGRAPVMRAVLMVCSFHGAYLLYRVAVPANSFALAWLAVCLWNPTAVFAIPTQLSFLAVGVLHWYGSQPSKPVDPLDRLLMEQRPLWWKIGARIVAKLGLLYLIACVVWLAVTPLIAARFHLVSPVALLIGPPVMLLMSVALLAGFLLLVTQLIWPLAIVFATITQGCLGTCAWLVTQAEQWPGAFWFVPDVADWWLGLFYLTLLAGLIIPILHRHRAGIILFLLGWLCFGLTLSLWRPPPSGMRCTFLAVGHGSCIVLETPDGRTILYDAGAIRGPEVTRQQIAPFLWSRGIRHLDDVYLSHADLDHFNGIPDLLERFAIGRICCTPSFADRDSAAVRQTLRDIANHDVELFVLQAGDHLTAGDLNMHVLHPPSQGPDGKENVRSLVLLLTYRDHTILLTGDLEDTGLRRVLTYPKTPVDVMLAPHHGSHIANTDNLADWASPKLVVSSQGQPRSKRDVAGMYKKHGAMYLTTWEHGAVSVECSRRGLWLETFRSKLRWKLR